MPGLWFECTLICHDILDVKALWLNYIELFAGCGGLSLGLEASGHNLVIANELSPMAAETFAYNFFNESLDVQNPEHTLWVNSNFPKNEDDRSGSGIGVDNLRKRLQLLYPNKHEFNTYLNNGMYIVEMKLETE